MLLWNYEYSAFGIAKKTIETEKTKSGLMLFITGLISLYMIGCIFGLGFFLILLSLSMIFVPFLMPYFLYIFASLLRVISTIPSKSHGLTGGTVAVGDDVESNLLPIVTDEGNKSKGPSYSQNILSLICVLIALQSLGIGHLYGFGALGSITPALLYIVGYIFYNVKFVTGNQYSTTKILVSKIVPITIVLAIIIVLYSGYYGLTVMICVAIIFLAIWFTCNKHKILFYPYDPIENETFVKFTDNIQTYLPILCTKSKNPTDKKGDIEKIIDILLEMSKKAEAVAKTNAKAEADTAPSTTTAAPGTATAAPGTATAAPGTTNNEKSKPLFDSPSIKLTTSGTVGSKLNK